MSATVIPFQPGAAGDRLGEMRVVAKAIEQEPGRETEFLERLAKSFFDAPLHAGDEVGSVIKDLLAALLKNRGKAMPEVSHCSRCGVQMGGAAEHQHQHQHSALCRNIDGIETELSDEAVIAGIKVLKRRDEAEKAQLSDDLPF